MRRLAAALGVLALAASAFGAAPDPKDPAQVRAKRREQLAQTEGDLKEFCSAVRGWKVADPLLISADQDVLTKADASEEAKTAARARIRDFDGDAADLPDAQKNGFRTDVRTVKETCGKIEDADLGLPVLLRDGAKLEKIWKKDWDGLTDKLGAVVLSYKGKDAFGDEADQNFSNCYEQDCLSSSGKQSAKLKLASDASAQLSADFEDVVPNAIADVGGTRPEPTSDGSP